MQLAVSVLPQVLHRGVAVGIIVELLAVRMAAIVVLSMPMAFLVAILTVFGKFSADNEIIALQASGKSVVDLLPPFLAVGALTAVLLFFFVDRVLPDANHHATTLFRDIIRKRPAAMIEAGTLLEDFPGYALLVDSIDHTSGEIFGVTIFERDRGQIHSLTYADHGTVFLTKDEQFVEFSLYDGGIYRVTEENAFYQMDFESHHVYIENSEGTFQRSSGGTRGDREKSTAQLMSSIEGFEEDIRTYRHSHGELLDDLRRVVSEAEKPHDTLSFSSYEEWQEALSALDSRIRPHRSVRMSRSVTAMRVNRIERREKNINSYLVEYHKKFALGVAVLVFALLGPPLGIITRSGSPVIGAVYSFIFFVIYYAFLIAGEHFGDEGYIPPAVAMWSGNVLIGGIALYIMSLLLRGKTLSMGILIPWCRWCFGSLFRLVRREQTMLKKFSGWVLYKFSRLFRLPIAVSRGIFGILPTYILGVFAALFMVILLGLTGLTIVIDYITDMYRLQGATAGELFWYYVHFLAGFFSILLPIAALLATMLTMGSIQGSHELDAIRAAGKSVVSVTKPLVFTGVFLSLFSFCITELALPERDQETDRLLRTFAARRRGEEIPEETRAYKHDFFYFERNGDIYHFRHLQTSPPRGQGVTRVRPGDTRAEEFGQMGSVVYEDGGWIGKDIRRWSTHEEGLRFARDDTMSLAGFTERPHNVVATVHGGSNASIAQLREAIERYEIQGRDPAKYEARLYFKFFLPWMNLVVVFLGIAVSVSSGSKNRAVHFGKGVLFALLYWVGAQGMLMMGENSILSPFFAASAGTILFFFIGIAMYWRVSQ
ncbi:LptF/LptG family permease [Chitinivibrio alkaliphilus]|nr:LptF/LptG family permease [Chitinivibrio alkaliphilus]